MSSEKRFLLAVALSFLILILYPVYLKWVSPPIPQTSVDERAAPVPAGPKTSLEPIQSAREEIFKEAQAKKHFFSHRYFDAEFSERGASLTHLKLKKWDKPHSSEITLIKGAESAAFLADLPNQGIDFTTREFTLELFDLAGGEVRFSSEEAGKWALIKTFRFDSDRPVIWVEVQIKNMSTATQVTAFELMGALTILPKSRNDGIQAQSFVALPDKLESVKMDKAVKKPHIFEGQIRWQALCEKYFGIFVRPNEPAALSQTTAVHGESEVLRGLLRFAPAEIAPLASRQYEFLVYAGPQYYKELKAFGYGFEETLSHGFFGLFRLWLLTALQWTHQMVGNYGWAIILITCVVKLLFTPLTHMSFESMKRMQALQPKLKALQERYKNDQAALSKEMMGLYKKNKVNPMGGCLPMLLQIPIFIAFYQVLAQTVELRGEPFIFWIKDLSEVDRAWTLPFEIPFLGDAVNILPLLMLGSMVWQQKLTPMTGTPEQQKMMMFMPIVFGFIFYSLPSGLVLYWFVNNLLSIFHQLFIKGKALPHT
jgi:YidC/Oxa1 family membrane protein insertase